MKSPLPFLIAAVAAVIFAASSDPAQAHSPDASLSEEQARQDASILQRALKELHPALTKYRTQAEMDAAFSRFDARAQSARTASEMYLAATELAAAIRCPHHIMEAIFKALAKALDQATMLEERLAGKVLSTKGML